MTVAASAAGPTRGRLGSRLVAVGDDLGENFDVRNLADVTCLHVILDLLDNLQHASSSVVLVKTRLQPARDGGTTSHAILILVILFCVPALSSL